MASWLAPFVTLIAILAVYFFRKDMQAGMQRDVNFYMICILVTAAAAIISGWNYGPDWTDYLAWGVAGLAIILCLGRAFTSKSAEVNGESSIDREGPLGRGR